MTNPAGGADVAEALTLTFFLAFVLISILAVFRALRRRVVNWRHPIALAAFAGILFVIWLINASNLGFNLPAGRTWISHLLGQSGLLIVFTVLVVILVLIFAGASLVLPRQSATRALLGYETMFTRSWDRDTLRKVLLLGYGAGFAMALGDGLANFGCRFFTSTDLDLDALGWIDLYLPWLAPIVISLGEALAIGVTGLIVVGFLARFVKPQFVVAILVAIGLVIDVVAIANGSAPLFASWFLLVAAITLLRFGAVALMIAAFVSLILDQAGNSIASGVPELFVLGIITFIAVGLPAAVAP